MSNNNLSARAYDEIINDIVMLNINPGDSIQERQLADSLEMSRTPIREAIGRLAHEGWLQVNARRNIQVRPLTETDINEVIEVRKILEFLSIEKTFETRTVSGLQATLGGFAATMREMHASKKNFLQHDKFFHDAIIAGNPNRRLGDFWKRIGLEFLRMGMMGLEGRGFSCASVQEEHDNIVAALATRRKKDVRKRIEEHLETTRTYLLGCLG